MRFYLFLFSLSLSFFLFSFPCFAHYLIGAGISDITGPAAEVGMMGYAKPDQIVQGIHMRLRSRAFIFVDPKTQKRIVFVSADLAHIFQSIKNGVVDALKAQYGEMYTDENVMLSATHTHSGPGGYAHEILFNITTLGFIPQNYHAIVNGIVQSIVQAHETLQPAKLIFNRGDIINASKNRSPEAYAANPVSETSQYPYPYDTRMTLLKMVAVGQNAEIGTVNWFALHGVSMSNLNKLISGDNKGYASYLFEKSKGVDYLTHPHFVAAFAQSNEGDVSPNVNNEKDDPYINDFKRTKEAGLKQYLKARELYETATENIDGIIDYRHAYIDLANIEVSNSANGVLRTSSASLGYSFAAGTKDGAGFFLFKEGTLISNPFIDMLTGIVAEPSTELKNLQRPKAILLPIGVTKPLPWSLSILPIQMFRIGPLLIVGVPAEFTTTAGRRLKETVKNVFGDEIKDVVIAGLSNAYSGYVTTAEEYAVQRYEGGFTLFGSQTLQAYQKEFAHLATDLKNHAHTFAKIAPQDYSHYQFTFQTGVIFDDVPFGKKFGSVITQPNKTYLPGDTVRTMFYGGHPKNNLKQNDTFLLVEKKEGDHWIKVADDGDWDTKYRWARSDISYSHISITWSIPNDATCGEYRIRHFGNYKNGWTGKIYPYEGTSQSFFVGGVSETRPDGTY